MAFAFHKVMVPDFASYADAGNQRSGISVNFSAPKNLSAFKPTLFICHKLTMLLEADGGKSGASSICTLACSAENS